MCVYPCSTFITKKIARTSDSSFYGRSDLVSNTRWLCCKLLRNYSVITAYLVNYCRLGSNGGYWPFNITVFWKVIRWEYVNLDSVTFRFSTVITWFRCSNFTDRLPLKKYRSTMATSRSQTRYAISQRILLLLLIPDERCHPHHGAHMLTSLDLKGIKKSLCSPSREITGLYGRTHIEF